RVAESEAVLRFLLFERILVRASWRIVTPRLVVAKQALAWDFEQEETEKTEGFGRVAESEAVLRFLLFERILVRASWRIVTPRLVVAKQALAWDFEQEETEKT